MKAKDEFLNLDFNQFFNNISQLESIGIGEMDVPEFEYNFETPFLDAFDTLSFIVGKAEENSSEKMRIASAVFWNQYGELSFGQMEYVVNSLMDLCEITDDYWTNVDEIRVSSGVWRGRSVILDFTLFIELDEFKGFMVSILGMNDFLNKTAQTY